MTLAHGNERYSYTHLSFIITSRFDMTFGQVFDTYQHMALVSAAVKFRQIKEVKHV